MKKHKSESIYLAISGESCKKILKECTGNTDQTESFARVLRGAKFVIFSQMTPQQQSEIVRMMSKRSSREATWCQRFFNFWKLSLQRQTAVFVVGNSTNDMSMMVEADLSAFIDLQQQDQICSSEAVFVADFISKGGRLHQCSSQIPILPPRPE